MEKIYHHSMEMIGKFAASEDSDIPLVIEMMKGLMCMAFNQVCNAIF